VTDPSGSDGDDNACFNASASLLEPITGCTDIDFGFDGVSYKQAWPGTFSNAARDASLHPSSVLFTSPLTNGQNYSQVAFEADLPRIENATSPPCQRHLANPADPSPGAGCVNPPALPCLAGGVNSPSRFSQGGYSRGFYGAFHHFRP
jgi:hypothetical protein